MKTKYKLIFAFLLVVVLQSVCFGQDNTQAGLPEGAIARLGKGEINAIQFSPDGKQIAVATEIGVWLYPIVDNKEKLLISIPHQPIRSLAFSSDGKTLACGGRANSIIQIWDLETSTNVNSFTLPHKYFDVTELTFIDNDETLVSIDYNEFIIEWDMNSGKVISKTKFHETDPETALSDDGKTIVCSDQAECLIRLWDAKTTGFSENYKLKPNPSINEFVSRILGRNPPKKEKKEKLGVQELAISPNGLIVGSAHDDNSVKIWDTETESELVGFKGHTEVINKLSFSSDNTRLASCSTDETIIVWDVKKRKQQSKLIGHKDNIKAITFSPVDKELLVSGSSDGTVRMWNSTTGKELAIISTGHTSSVKALAFTADNAMLCSGASNGTVQIWDVNTGKEFPSPSFPHQDTTTVIGFSSDATLFASNGIETKVNSEGKATMTSWMNYGKTQFWMMPTGDELTTFKGDAIDIAFSPDNKLAAFGLRESLIVFFDVNSGDLLHSIEVDKAFDRKVVFSPNGKLIATYGKRVSTRIWYTDTLKEISPPQMDNANALAFSPDSKQLALYHTDGIELWSVMETEIKQLKTVKFHTQNHLYYQNVILFSPDGKYLLEATTSWLEYPIQIWNVEDGKKINSLNGHKQWIHALAISHDGKLLASGSADGTILLWDWDKITANAIK